MNKTVNINLAGIFFHIDEDAFSRLQQYLDAIRNSLTNTHGTEEILADIEARIAELFSEKIKTERQVIGLKEVDDVIAVMGQPEDYILDDEVYEDEPTQATFSKKRKLFRDPDHSYIGGVSSGLAHYLRIDALWIRLLWVLLAIFSTGGFILIYIALWIFLPEAKTTADKLSMRGEPVTISNIERKIREGFDDVSGKVKDIDYEKYGYKVKSGAGSAATAVEDVVKFLLNGVVKLVGIFLLLVAGSTLIALFLGLFSLGTFGLIDAPWTDYIAMAGRFPENIWMISILSFLAVGIPFFFLFILGLKILSNNLRSIGRPIKLVLLGLWIISILGLIFFGIKEATESAVDEKIQITETLPIKAGDTLNVQMWIDPQLNSMSYRTTSFKVSYNANNEKVLWNQNVLFSIVATTDSLAKIEILKYAEGRTLEDARERSQNINYLTNFSNGKLELGGQLTTSPQNRNRNQRVRVKIFLPEGSVLKVAENTRLFRNTFDNILQSGYENKYLNITSEGIECNNCPVEEADPWNDEETESSPDWEDEWNTEEAVKETGKIDTSAVKNQPNPTDTIL